MGAQHKLLVFCPKELYPGELHSPVGKYRVESEVRDAKKVSMASSLCNGEFYSPVSPATWEAQG